MAKNNGTDLKTIGEMIEAADRISGLPDHVIHEIMSYLSTQEVAQTSTLSKRWNSLHTSFPILDFDYNYFLKDAPYTKSLKDEFKDFVDASLLRFCELRFQMKKLRLAVGFLDVEGLTFLIDKWIGLAIENEVKELEIYLLRGYQTREYIVPQTIFSAKSISSLKLSGCILDQPLYTIRFDSLKKLNLDSVYINEQIIHKITSECPLLEDLVFVKCYGFKHFHVSEAPKIRIIIIQRYCNEVESFKIVGPSLEQLELQCDMSSVERWRVIEVSECSLLNYLKLESFKMNDQEFHAIISKLPLLENLIVEHCASLKRIKVESDRLKKLVIRHCLGLKGIDIDTPNLVCFTYEYNSFPIAYIYAPCPWKVAFNKEDDLDGHWYSNIKGFLGVTNEIEELSAYFSAKRIFHMDKPSKTSYSLPCDVENLSIHVYGTCQSYAPLLDSLFWICCPSTLTVEGKPKEKNSFIEWLYRELLKGDRNCCTSGDIKCWWHRLKDCKIESFVSMKDNKAINADDLMDAWPKVPRGILRFGLDWYY